MAALPASQRVSARGRGELPVAVRDLRCYLPGVRGGRAVDRCESRGDRSDDRHHQRVHPEPDQRERAGHPGTGGVCHHRHGDDPRHHGGRRARRRRVDGDRIHHLRPPGRARYLRPPLRYPLVRPLEGPRLPRGRDPRRRTSRRLRRQRHRHLGPDAAVHPFRDRGSERAVERDRANGVPAGLVRDQRGRAGRTVPVPDGGGTRLAPDLAGRPARRCSNHRAAGGRWCAPDLHTLEPSPGHLRCADRVSAVVPPDRHRHPGRGGVDRGRRRRSKPRTDGAHGRRGAARRVPGAARGRGGPPTRSTADTRHRALVSLLARGPRCAPGRR